MALSQERIEKLAGAKGVKTIAVLNFLGSLGDLRELEAYGNLELDARLYKWNAATQKAIRKGIFEHFHPVR